MEIKADCRSAFWFSVERACCQAPAEFHRLAPVVSGTSGQLEASAIFSSGQEPEQEANSFGKKVRACLQAQLFLHHSLVLMTVPPSLGRLVEGGHEKLGVLFQENCLYRNLPCLQKEVILICRPWIFLHYLPFHSIFTLIELLKVDLMRSNLLVSLSHLLPPRQGRYCPRTWKNNFLFLKQLGLKVKLFRNL